MAGTRASACVHCASLETCVSALAHGAPKAERTLTLRDATHSPPSVRGDSRVDAAGDAVRGSCAAAGFSLDEQRVPVLTTRATRAATSSKARVYFLATFLPEDFFDFLAFFVTASALGTTPPRDSVTSLSSAPRSAS